MGRAVHVTSREIFDHRRLVSENSERLPEPAELEALLDCKQRLIQILDRHLTDLIPIPADLSTFQCHKVWLTLFELMIERVIRDDSVLALRGGKGIQVTLDEVRRAASLREGISFRGSGQPDGCVRAAVTDLKRAQDTYRKYTKQVTSPAPIRIWSGGSERFAPYGKILELPDRKVAAFFNAHTSPVYYVDGKVTGLRLGQDGVWEAGRIVMKQRPPEIYIEDYHEHTEEILVPDQPVILQVMAPRPPSRDYFNGELFYVPRGVVIYLYRGVRHFAPLPVYPGVTTSPVIFRLATTTDGKDFHHHHFKYRRQVLSYGTLRVNSENMSGQDFYEGA